MYSTIVLLIIVAIEVLTYLYFKKFIFQKWKTRADCFTLYKVRDELIELVAKGKLAEDDFLFQYFYPIINLLIKQSKMLNLSNFIKAVTMEINPTEEAIIKTVELELEVKNDKEINQTIANLYESVAIITLSNSSLLKILVFMVRINKYTKKFYTPIKQWEVYDEYKSAADEIYAYAPA